MVTSSDFSFNILSTTAKEISAVSVLPIQESLLPLPMNVVVHNSLNLCPMKSILYISSTAATISMVLPHENVNVSPVPALFIDRPPDYHMFLMFILFAFLGAFSALMCWVPYRVGPAHMHCQSSFRSLFQKSSMQVSSFNEKWAKHGEVWLLNEKCSKVSCHFLGQWLRRVTVWDTLKLTEQKKKESKCHSALLWAEEKQRAEARVQFGHIVCEFQREQNTKRYWAILRGAVRVKK